MGPAHLQGRHRRPNLTRHDPLQRDLDEAWREYQLLATYVAPGQGGGGRRPAPASRPPLAIDPVSHMAALEQFVAWWAATSRYIRNPPTKINLTNTSGVRCPYCDGELVAYLQRRDPDAPEPTTRPDEVACTNPHHLDTMGPSHWVEADWPRLGVMTGVHIDARFGARLPPLDTSVSESP